jgi:hypothetical protein
MPISPNQATIIRDIVSKTRKQLEYLYSRYQDEKQYEDFKEYENVMKTHVLQHAPANTKFIRANKKPFGCTIALENMDAYEVQIFVNAKRIGANLFHLG